MAGRPPIYDKEYHPKDVVARMSKGHLDCQIYAAWGISKKTFYKWQHEHPEFKEAYEIGLPKCEAKWLEKGIDYMENDKDKPFRYWIAVQNNKFGWSQDRKEMTNQTTNIHVNQLNVLQNKSQAELDEFNKSLALELKEAGVIDVSFEVIGPVKEDVKPAIQPDISNDE